jgi:hypothetical protein
MPTLSAYANTENTSLVILKQKGYKVWYDEKIDMYGAEKDGWDFLANSATELVGVIGIYEYHGSPREYKEYWWKIDEPWLLRSVPKEKHDYTAIYEKPKT